MISTLIKAPARTAVGTVRLFYRPSVWLVQTVAGVALKPLQREHSPESPTAPRFSEPPSGAGSASPSARQSASTSKPRTPRRSGSTSRPKRESARGRATTKDAARSAPRTRVQTPRTREAPVTLPPADPDHPGVPGRDAPPALPSEPHHMLNTPVGEPDPTEWPDPYDRRPDPRAPDPDEPLPLGDSAHPPTGAQSTSEPHPDQDPEAAPPKFRERDQLDG